MTLKIIIKILYPKVYTLSNMGKLVLAEFVFICDSTLSHWNGNINRTTAILMFTSPAISTPYLRQSSLLLSTYSAFHSSTRLTRTFQQ